MIRVTALEILLVATPFVLFFLYRMLVNTKRAGSDEPIDETPYQILFFVGAATALAALVIAVLTRDTPANPRDLVYVPPHSENGEIIEGYFVTREEAIAQGLIAPAGEQSDAGGEPDA